MSESGISIPGYRIDGCIAARAASTLYRARRELDGSPVVLKAINAEYPESEELTRYRHEHEMTRALADLEQCLGQWRRRGLIDRFPLGSRDIPDCVHVSRRLYGRDREIADFDFEAALETLRNIEEGIE